MKILFITTNIYPPQYYGGLETSLDGLCPGLIQKGHKVTVLSDIARSGLFGWVCVAKMKINKIIKSRKISRDTRLGYPVWRTWFVVDDTAYVAEQEKADLIVIMGGKVVPAAKAAQKTGIPVLIQVHDVEFHSHGGDFKELGQISCIANSNFTAQKYNRAFGISPLVIYPFVPATSYSTKTRRENVTFINLRPHKGLAIAIEIARLCPAIPFCFVGSGRSLQDTFARELINKLSILPNVTLIPAQKDMRKIYSKCKILLMPSVWEEAFGRVAAEAQISGIPVVASNRGGLPEAVGPGGILIDPEGPIEKWIGAIRKLWQDEKYYAELSAAALAHAQRTEMNFSYQLDAHENALLAAAGRQKHVR